MESLLTPFLSSEGQNIYFIFNIGTNFGWQSTSPQEGGWETSGPQGGGGGGAWQTSGPQGGGGGGWESSGPQGGGGMETSGPQY